MSQRRFQAVSVKGQSGSAGMAVRVQDRRCCSGRGTVVLRSELSAGGVTETSAGRPQRLQASR